MDLEERTVLILYWLGPTGLGKRHVKIRCRRQPNTSDWAFKALEVRNLIESQSVFILSGYGIRMCCNTWVAPVRLMVALHSLCGEDIYKVWMSLYAISSVSVIGFRSVQKR